MIVLDGSSLFAILLDEPEAARCGASLDAADELLISAASYAECLIVAARKGLFEEMNAFINALEPEIATLTPVRARAAVGAYRIWGKGFHKASLNFGDSFAYALAKELECPLLFVGNDFAATDSTPA